MTQLCPYCGYNLTADTPILKGEWRLTPQTTEYRGRTQNLSRTEAAILHTLAKADGRYLHGSVIGDRVSDSSEDPRSVVAVLMCRIRKKLAHCPVESDRQRGYRWKDAA